MTIIDYDDAGKETARHNVTTGSFSMSPAKHTIIIKLSGVSKKIPLYMAMAWTKLNTTSLRKVITLPKTYKKTVS